MRKDVNKKSNNKSKVVSALAMLLVSAVALSSASYAWFTMSKSVKVEGIQLQATAPDNVLIAKNSEAFDTITPYASTKTVAADSKDMYRGGTETNLNSADLLLPCSSIDGVALYATEDINDDGSDKTADSDYKVADSSTISADKAGEIYYVDIPLYILTTGSSDVQVAIDTKESAITAEGDNTNIFKAARFAVLDADATDNAGGTFAADNTMFGNPVESLQNANKAKYADGNTATLLGTDVSGTAITLKGTGNAGNAKDVSGKYDYEKVVVRVWIEGQNKACVTANADQKFNVKLVFKAIN